MWLSIVGKLRALTVLGKSVARAILVGARMLVRARTLAALSEALAWFILVGACALLETRALRISGLWVRPRKTMRIRVFVFIQAAAGCSFIRWCSLVYSRSSWRNARLCVAMWCRNSRSALICSASGSIVRVQGAVGFALLGGRNLINQAALGTSDEIIPCVLYGNKRCIVAGVHLCIW